MVYLNLQLKPLRLELRGNVKCYALVHTRTYNKKNNILHNKGKDKRVE